MKLRLIIFIAASMTISLVSCSKKEISSDTNIIFLHHSTGSIIWNGRPPSFFKKVAGRISSGLGDKVGNKGHLPSLLKKYNKENGKDYLIKEQAFPKAAPYGWNNFPYDYYNIWVKNAGAKPFMDEPTLELLTKDYHVIIFKHCFPVCYIQEDQDSADINSDLKTSANYMLQYAALRDKLHEFPNTKFILFTGAAQVQNNISDEAAKRAYKFFGWVRDKWDIPNDNIYL
ncbi:MAG: hypothetical protein K8S14_09165 [Actinomycetia bacterium]|nr:hypothetical protein [Actinomycetes bacterium]